MENDLRQNEEDARTFRLQERFDIRYVLRDGVWKLALSLVFGLAGLILTAVFAGLMGIFTGIIHIP